MNFLSLYILIKNNFQYLLNILTLKLVKITVRKLENSLKDIIFQKKKKKNISYFLRQCDGEYYILINHHAYYSLILRITRSLLSDITSFKNIQDYEFFSNLSQS